ncbi:hypothetical protein SUDANB178_04294 [Streptomyces sp. enrichment culture]
MFLAQASGTYADFEGLRERTAAGMIKVPKGADLYRRIEGAWYGIVLGADSAT